MIGVERGPEPPALAAARIAGLAQARVAIEAGREPELDGYQCARYLLWERQHQKCAWCERSEVPSYSDVEHYRPKKVYWWLAWSWENLLFSCSSCNRSGKRDSFPLADEAHRLRAEEPPPGEERPLLLDPANEEPTEHIRFLRLGGRWTPVPRNGSRRGAETIRILRLDHNDLLAMYSLHVKRLEPWIVLVERAMDGGGLHEVSDVWTRMVESYLAPGAPFIGLTRDVLEARFSVQVRRRWSLHLSDPAEPACFR